MLNNQRKELRWVLRFIAFLLLMSTILTVCACGNQNDEDDEPVTTKETGELSADTPDDTKEENPGSSETELPGETDSNTESRKTTLVMNGATANIGDTAVEVVVEIKNNPGILGIDFDVYYDDSALKLVNAESKLDVAGCNYTPPAYYRNPTTFLWDFQDANWIDDRDILILYFEVLDTATVGEHEIKVMYGYGNIFDAEGQPIDVQVENTCITIEQ